LLQRIKTGGGQALGQSLVFKIDGSEG
jgi:hypothetical protein